jgi:hypothetical protein
LNENREAVKTEFDAATSKAEFHLESERERCEKFMREKDRRLLGWLMNVFWMTTLEALETIFREMFLENILSKMRVPVSTSIVIDNVNKVFRSVTKQPLICIVRTKGNGISEKSKS